MKSEVQVTALEGELPWDMDALEMIRELGFAHCCTITCHSQYMVLTGEIVLPLQRLVEPGATVAEISAIALNDVR